MSTTENQGATADPVPAPAPNPVPQRPYTDYASPIFNLIIKIPTEDDYTSSSSSDTKASASASRTTTQTYSIHKSILASLSPELHKHCFNTMLEGTTNSMTLADVSRETIELFLQWAYEGIYNPPATYGLSVMHDAQLYCFGDRFNISKLQSLALKRIKKAFKEVDEKFDWTIDPLSPAGRAVMASLVELLGHLYENLPCDRKGVEGSGEGSEEESGGGGGGEPLLDFVTAYAAWALPALRKDERWDELLANSSFMGKLLEMLPKATACPK